MKTTQETSLGCDQVVYMADSLGLHKISNPDSEEYAVSLHCMLLPSCQDLIIPRYLAARANDRKCTRLPTPPSKAARFSTQKQAWQSM